MGHRTHLSMTSQGARLVRLLGEADHFEVDLRFFRIRRCPTTNEYGKFNVSQAYSPCFGRNLRHYGRIGRLFWNSTEQGCRLVYLEKVPASYEEAVEYGVCTGAILTLINDGSSLVGDRRFCPPSISHAVEGVAVLMRFIEGNPAIRAEPLLSIASKSFRKAWPCS